ncbi:MAG: hypothetical protein ACM3X5_04250 [Bacillota bacterium]
MRTTTGTFLGRIAGTVGGVLVALAAQAATLSDLWWNASESGWGANIIEQEGVLFITFFVYGADGRPAWYVASNTAIVANSSPRRYSGPLYVTSGPWFGSAFNPAQVGIRNVGVVTLVRGWGGRGTLTYSVDGVQIVKNVERQTWKGIDLDGTYYGAMAVLSSSTCVIGDAASKPAPLPWIDVTLGANGTLTMDLTDMTGMTLTVSGPYVQHGSIYELDGTLDVLGNMGTARLRDLTADDASIHGVLSLEGDLNCQLDVRFAGARADG